MEERLKNTLVNSIFDPETELDVEEDLFEAGLDSMGIMQLLLILEDEYQVKIEAHEVTRSHFQTVKALSQLVNSKLAG